MSDKKCNKCGHVLPISEFYIRSDHASHHSACKACERLSAKKWYDRNRDKAKANYGAWRAKNPEAVKKYRAANRRKSYHQEVQRRYGVDQQWFDRQMLEQDGKCVGCGIEFAWGDKFTCPHVDHCHQTNVVRGLLCNRCNSVLGLTKDRAEVLDNLAEYLRKCHGHSAML